MESLMTRILREKRLHTAKLVEQARAGKKVVLEGC